VSIFDESLHRYNYLNGIKCFIVEPSQTERTIKRSVWNMLTCRPFLKRTKIIYECTELLQNEQILQNGEALYMNRFTHDAIRKSLP
jgi:hypothetical protein